VGIQTFDLVDERWRIRARRDRLVTFLAPIITAALAVFVTLRLWMLYPAQLGLTLELWGLGGVMLAAIMIVVGGGDPTRMTITSTTLEFARHGRYSFTIRLDKEKVSATLIDQSANPAVAKGSLGAFPPYFAVFSQAIESVPLTAEAFEALRRELPGHGFVLTESGPAPLLRGTLRYVYRKGYRGVRLSKTHQSNQPLPP
jgi:hypothetical protein